MDRYKIRIIGLYTIALLITIKFIYIPTNNLIKTYKETFEEKTQNYKLKEDSYNRLLKQLSEKKKKKSDVFLDKIYREDIPEAFIQTNLLEYTQKIVKQTSLEMVTFELPPSAEGEYLTEISILLRLKGSPKDIFSFIEKCRNFDKIIVVKSFENTRQSDTDMSMFFKLKLSTYKYSKR